MSEAKPRCKNLVLDAGPLLSLTPLRGLAETYLTVSQVLEELKDKQAREHFERLELTTGIRVEARSPDATSLAHVIQFAKKTGDYAVLSHADICVLALTHTLHEREKARLEKIDKTRENEQEEAKDNAAESSQSDDIVHAGCMTGDFAMQNVLLQMGLNLVGNEGKRIQKVKSWVLRCHACFKICKDNTKQFCPSCGNPTLLRTSVTVSSPDAASDTPVMQIHLKKNFQYRLRGTKYSIPAPKPGSAKSGPGEGLILREDQLEYVRAKKRVDGQREREEQKMINNLSKRGDGNSSLGNWMDPDWTPDFLSGKARSNKHEMPTIGYGRKNPNERKRTK